MVVESQYHYHKVLAATLNQSINQSINWNTVSVVFFSFIEIPLKRVQLGVPFLLCTFYLGTCSSRSTFLDSLRFDLADLSCIIYIKALLNY